MVKSYLGFGMTHIREEATGCLDARPSSNLGKFIDAVCGKQLSTMQVHQVEDISLLFGGFSSILSNHGKGAERVQRWQGCELLHERPFQSLARVTEF